MALIDDIPEPTEHHLSTYTRLWEAGTHPPWRRVWHDGVDVTDLDPARWPALWRTPDVRSRSRAGRSSRKG